MHPIHWASDATARGQCGGDLGVAGAQPSAVVLWASGQFCCCCVEQG